MADAAVAESPPACPRCATELPARALACPACAALVHRDRLIDLSNRAVAAASAGDSTAARALWEEAQALVPPRSLQYQQIRERLAALPDMTAGAAAPAASEHGTPWGRIAGGAGAVGVLVIGKLKFLLLGLGKLSTVASMFGFIAVYWSIYGWPLAAGLGASIYVHEMGHVSMLRRLGIRAGAPLFIPGVGALVMLKEHVADPIANARIGLAGPVWGLGAAVAAMGIHAITAAPIWKAIAELTAFLNLFNLIPIWQLDGSRGFEALSASERWAVFAIVVLALSLTNVGVLWVVAAAALYRALATPAGPGHPQTLATFAALVVVLSWLARTVA
jgi:Zn-dependent protease